MLFGYLYAIAASLFFAVYIVPKKLTKQKPLLYSFFMGIGFLFGSIILYLTSFFTLNHFGTFINKNLVYSALAGVLWAFGSIFLLSSIDKIGLTRSNQWKNLQGPIGVILSLIVLSEFIHTNALFAVLAGVSIFISALFLNVKHSDGNKIDPKGVSLAVLSALMFGIVTVLNKFVTDNSGVYAQLVVWSFFTFATIAIYILSKNNLRAEFRLTTKKDASLGFVGGLLYSAAGFSMLKSYSYIPASISFTIIQLNFLWVLIIGIVFFKEIDYKKNIWRISGGIIFAAIGIIFLLYAKK
jgi:drug/metabolite transporter (DMT)-like permease